MQRRNGHRGPKRFRHRKLSQQMADGLTQSFGTFGFFLANFIFFVVWIVCNLQIIPTLPVFDPYPFNFLTMFVSLEAIFLSIIVLMSQNTAAKIADIREETDFRVNVQAEKEITKILRMLDAMSRNKEFSVRPDPELRSMKRTLNIEKIASQVVKDLESL